MHIDVASLEFRDPDAFQEHVAGWNLEIVPLSRGGLSLAWNQIAFDDMIIAHHGVSGAFADVSAVDQGWLFFIVCLAPTGTIWCGLDIEPGHLLIMAPGREHRSRIEQWISLEIAISDTLVEEAGVLDSAMLPKSLTPEQCLLPLDHAHLTAFKALARSFEAQSIAEAQLRDELLYAIRERTLELLKGAVTRGLARLSPANPARRVARYDLAVRALAIMDASDHETMSLSQLSDRLGATPRAIQYALKSGLGVSPYQYLLARRLLRVRRDLLRRHTTVTTAAFQHGFDNLSRFAHQYRRLFGERPSETLTRIQMMTARPDALARK